MYVSIYVCVCECVCLCVSIRVKIITSLNDGKVIYITLEGIFVKEASVLYIPLPIDGACTQQFSIHFH